MLTIATWNLENLFRPPEDADQAKRDKYAAKIQHMKAVIEAVDPDVLGVQEVGDPEALETDLVGALGGTWHVELSNRPDGRGIRVGFLSKLALHDREDVTDFPAALKPIQQSDDGDPSHRMGRGALRVRINHNGLDVDLVVCHLKSKLLEFPHGAFDTTDEDLRARVAAFALFRRAAEAATVRCYVDGLLADDGEHRALVVMGDLNDEAAAATTQMLLGPPGSQIGTRGFDTRDRHDGMRLWNLAPLIPEGEGWSRTFEGRHELIDHLLASARLVGPHKLPGVRVHHQTTASVTTDPHARAGDPASDHDPVYAQFDL